jgi:flagellar export protein FliJ
LNKAQIWSLLASRAEKKAAGALAMVGGATQVLDGLVASERRVRDLHAEYARRLRDTQSESHGMAQIVLLRRYIAHIEMLQERLALSRVKAEGELAAARERYLAAEAEHKKMIKLCEREDERVRRVRQEKELRAMDAAAIAQFNRR